MKIQDAHALRSRDAYSINNFDFSHWLIIYQAFRLILYTNDSRDPLKIQSSIYPKLYVTNCYVLMTYV